jgi:hypothetical protein
MNANAFLDDFTRRGIRLVRVGDMVHADVRTDVDLTPFVPLIKERKAELLAELQLREEIVAAATAATAAPEAFDRVRYDALWIQWQIRNDEEQP